MKPIKKRILHLAVLCFLLLASVAAFLYAFNMCLYHAWLTAAPPEANHARSQHLSIVWFWVSVGIGILACILVTRIFASSRKLRALRRPPGTCPVCGYDRNESPGICPECGTENPPRP